MCHVDNVLVPEAGTERPLTHSLKSTHPAATLTRTHSGSSLCSPRAAGVNKPGRVYVELADIFFFFGGGGW